MGTLTETAQIADKRRTPSLPEKPRELRLWLIDQVTILAEAFGEEPDARLRLYAQDLSEVARPQLEIAFGRARRELKFFPKISELLGDGRREARRRARRFSPMQLGITRSITYESGVWIGCRSTRAAKRIDAPMLPPRIEYALRRVGGLRGLNQITSESRPFVQKDFTEAYQQAPIAESLAPQLGSLFGDRKF